ncbi:MAG: energy-coupled thiamine transporter ThiT [Oscillospiraceae bacterium]|nr:energy-coupled thiamine transporter ThiT [Oscillospiraceae bacterium]
MNKQHNTVRAMVEGAIFVAIAEVLGYFPKLWQMPYGGSVTLMMVPIIIYALRWGLGQGLLAGLALGVLDFMLNGGISIGWQSIIGDYVAALTALGLAGIGHKKGFPGIILGSAAGCLGRFVCIWITGATLWGEYMFDVYGLPMDNEFVYSFLYNIPVLISGVLAVIVCTALYNIKATQKYMLGEDIA